MGKLKNGPEIKLKLKNKLGEFTGSNIRSIMKKALERCEKNSNEVRFYCFGTFEELAAFLVDKSPKNI